ncbi:MAG: peptidase, partial [Caulobacteraceae bacterium]|nr:peptidase [Caulobacteraceae bacterium]
MRNLLLGAAALALLAAPASAADAVLDPAAITAHVRVLSSDAFEGRGPATPGEVKTVDYITGQFKAAGLQPGGDPLPAGGRAWTQDVPLARFAISGPVTVQVKAGAETRSWAQGDQISIRAAQTGASRVDIKNAPVVFIGYGVDAPERKWDDFKGVDLKGKVALVLVNDPDFETGSGDFG